MPLTSQGTAVTFNGGAIGSVVGVSGSFTTALKEIRPLANTVAPDTGQYLPIYEQTNCEQTVELEVLAGSFDLSTVGAKGPLSVGGVGWSFSFGTAICESIKLTAKVGDLVRLNCSFKRSFE